MAVATPNGRDEVWCYFDIRMLGTWTDRRILTAVQQSENEESGVWVWVGTGGWIVINKHKGEWG